MGRGLCGVTAAQSVVNSKGDFKRLTSRCHFCDVIPEDAGFGKERPQGKGEGIQVFENHCIGRMAEGAADT